MTALRNHGLMVDMTNSTYIPTATELTEAIATAISLNKSGFPTGITIDIDAAIDAIWRCDIQPWVQYANDDCGPSVERLERDELADAYALAIVMNDGPWWVTGNDA